MVSFVFSVVCFCIFWQGEIRGQLLASKLFALFVLYRPEDENCRDKVNVAGDEQPVYMLCLNKRKQLNFDQTTEFQSSRRKIAVPHRVLQVPPFINRPKLQLYWKARRWNYSTSGMLVANLLKKQIFHYLIINRHSVCDRFTLSWTVSAFFAVILVFEISRRFLYVLTINPDHCVNYLCVYIWNVYIHIWFSSYL